METVGILSLVLLYLTIFCACSSQLLQNGEMENTNKWTCPGCTMAVNSDKHGGHHSIKITNRQSDHASPRQTVHVTPGHRYVAQCFFKLANMKHGHAYMAVVLTVSLHNSGKRHYKTISNIRMQQMKFGWTEIGGDFLVDSGNNAEVYLQMDQTLDFLLDDCSITELVPDSTWKTKAQSRIYNTRKASITLNLSGPTDTDGYYLELIQEKRSFAWGTAVRMSHITDNFTQYQNFLYKNFEWAVPSNAMKWKLMEWSKGKEKYDWLPALDVMLSHGLKVRGHNMFWATDKHAPVWLGGMSHDQVVTEMKRHVNSMVSHTKGKLQHWDVNNENLHGDFYERHTGNPDITNDMFSWIHNLEPGVKLFLNEFNVVTSSEVTTAIKNEAVRMKSAGVPLYGVGIQAHFHSGNIDIDSVKYRLDKVAEAGLPIWITEFTITESDDKKQAAALDDVLTLFYSHPAVEGILIWGFWDGAIFDPKAAITTGPNVTLRAAGHTYENLVNNDWKTHLRRQITSSQPIHTTVFTGDYLLITRHQGKIIHQQRFSIGKGGKTLTVHLQDNTHVSHIAFG